MQCRNIADFVRKSKVVAKGGVAYTGTVGAEKCTPEPQAAAVSQLPEFWKTGAGSRAHCLNYS